ncbi:MAG: L-threonylcarbamoyladenylate synthase [Clostridia bacterium]|nr:L-threonylcarbamoyladenylate synthase [Clostridia bacterium]
MTSTKCLEVKTDKSGELTPEGVAAIGEGGEILRHNGLVAFPTETVYGLGANALSPEAVEGIFRAKGRPGDNPLIVHIAHWSMLEPLVKAIPPEARQLAEKFWPGPLTLVLPSSSQVPQVVTAGLPTVAVRMPDHPVALALIKEAGVPVAAPSANTSGKPSPTAAVHVLEDLGGKVPLVLDGGPVGLGVESTVLDLTVSPPMVLRPGSITLEMLRDVLGQVDLDPAMAGMDFPHSHKQEAPAPKAPGMKYAHYSPEAEVVLVDGPVEEMTAAVLDLAAARQRQGLKVGIMASRETVASYQGFFTLVIGSRQDLTTVAVNLYSLLRDFDRHGVQVVIAEGFSWQGLGLAIMNRLTKAADKIIKV